MKKIRFIILIFIISCAVPVFSLERESYEFYGGTVFLGNKQDNSENFNMFTYFAFSMPLKTKKQGFLVVPEVKLWGAEYKLVDDRAVPAAIEYADTAYFYSLMFDVNFCFEYIINEKVKWAWLLSPAINLRIPGLVTHGDGDSQQTDMFTYFYENLRFFYPGAGAYVKWKINENIGLSFKTEFYYPIFNLMDSESPAFYDQGLVYTGVGLIIYAK